jgi:hypothetical protein
MKTPAEDDLTLIREFEQLLESASSVQSRTAPAQALSARITTLLRSRVRTTPVDSEAPMDRAFEDADLALMWLWKALMGNDPEAHRPLPDAIAKAREELAKWKKAATDLLNNRK